MLLINASFILAIIWIITGLFLVEPGIEKASAFIIANLWIIAGTILSAIRNKDNL